MNDPKEPLSLIITGVGGQGNILISRVLGEALVGAGYQVTIGETYGASQRGGSVASHVRISRRRVCSPITPKGSAHIVLGLEPVETMRILCLFGSPETVVLTNTRPIHPVAVATGDADYPSLAELETAIRGLSKESWFVDASRVALDLGASLLTNVVMMGALAARNLLPISADAIEGQLRLTLDPEKLEANLEAFRRGMGSAR